MTDPQGPRTPADAVRMAWSRHDRDTAPPPAGNAEMDPEMADGRGDAGGPGEQERTYPPLASILAGSEGASRSEVIDAITADAEERWSRGIRAGIEHYRKILNEPWADDPEVIRGLLMSEVSARAAEGMENVGHELKARLPELCEEIEAVLELAGIMHSARVDADGDNLYAGQTLGAYRLEEWLGAGSFGEVWLAWDTSLERYVALKLLRSPPRDDDQEVMRRVLAEAQAAAALDHENIVKVHAAGRFEGTSRCYIDGQLVGDPDPTPENRRRVKVGRTLSALVTDETGTSHPMEPRRAAAIMAAIARGVAAAHARGIVHRDVKPSNILVTDAGRPMITDFGLSVAMPMSPVPGHGPTPTVTITTRQGRITGTPAFMSPEQADGKPALPASDVYSLGATLRFLLTGRLPMEASGRHSPDDRWDVVEQLRRRELRPLGDSRTGLPRDLCAICDRAMAWLPGDRYVSSEQMAADLEDWLGHRGVRARPPGIVRAGALWIRRHAAVAAVSGLALVAGAVGLWRYVVNIDRERIRAVEAERQTAAHLAEAQRERSITESVNAFLQGVLSAADPNLLGHEVTMLQAVRFSAGEVEARFRRQPQVEGKVRATLGSTYRMLGLYTEARSELERALAIQQAQFGPTHRDTLWTRLALLALEGEQSDVARTLPGFRRLATDTTEALGSSDSLTLAVRLSLGMALASGHLFGESAAVLDGVINEVAAGAAIDRENLFKARIALAQNRFYLGDAARAIEELEACVRELGEALGHDNIARLNAMTILSSMHLGSKRPAEARRWAVAAYEGLGRILPPGHDLILTAARELAILDLTEGNPRGAVDLLEPEIERVMSRHGHNPMQVARAHEILGNAYSRLDRWLEAESALLLARAGFVGLLGGEENSLVRRISASLAVVYENLGRDDLRDQYLRKAGSPGPAEPGQPPR